MPEPQLTGEVIVLDFDKLEVYEAGAVLVSVLAYPQPPKSEDPRPHLHRALCALALRARSEIDEPWALSPQLIKPIYLCGDRVIEKSLKTLKRRLRDRMVAGRMGMAFLKDVVTRGAFTLPSKLKRLSVNQLSEFVLDDAGQNEPKNVGSRIWRSSLPVIHLAAVLQDLLQFAERARYGPVHVGHLLWDRELIEAVVRRAQEFEALFAKSRLPINPENLVRIRLA